jgi:hypothetical protein
MKQLDTKTANCTVEQLTEKDIITIFDCGDEELNDFLLNDAQNYMTSLLAMTYLIKLRVADNR